MRDDYGVGFATFSDNITLTTDLGEVVVTETAGETDPQIICQSLRINTKPGCIITPDPMRIALDEYYGQ